MHVHALESGPQLREANEFYKVATKFSTNAQFVEKFENKFVSQGPYQNRSIFESLDLAWDLLRTFPPQMLNKIDPKMREKYYRRSRGPAASPVVKPQGD